MCWGDHTYGCLECAIINIMGVGYVGVTTLMVVFKLLSLYQCHCIINIKVRLIELHMLG